MNSVIQSQGEKAVQNDDESAGFVQGGALSRTQRRLVTDHMGLVGVHLRRFGGNLSSPRHDREREDLFQEGCLGLMRAAVDFDESRGIPFPAFALPRIHNAVSRALESKFSTIYVPRGRKRSSQSRAGRGDGDCGSDRGGSRSGSHLDESRRHRPCAPSVRSMSDWSECGARCPRPSAPEVDYDVETIGDRLRGKCERAVRRAGELVARRGGVRRDRGKLVAIIAEERLLVPEPSHRRALRQIARDTGSSYARVADCERSMIEKARSILIDDPEFRALNERAKATTVGVAGGVDEGIEIALAQASAAEFMRRFGAADRVERAVMLERLLQDSQREIKDIVEKKLVRMNPAQRERLFTEQE